MDDDTRQYPAFTTQELEDELQTAVRDVEEQTDDVVDPELVREMTAVTAIARPQRDEPSAALLPDPPSGPLSDWEERALALRHEIAAASSSRRAAVLLYELGRLMEIQLQRVEDALACHRESYERFPGFVANLRALGRLLLQRGEHVAYLDVLKAELAVAVSGGDRVAILVERATIRLRHCNDIEGALADLSRALDIEPGDPIALDMLAEVYTRAERWSELELLLRRQLRAVEEPRLRAAVLCEIARIREDRLADVEEAAALYRTALSAHPEGREARRAVLRTARALDDHPTTAKVEESLADASHGAAAAGHLWHAARIYAGKLRNHDLALAALERACQIGPSPALLQALAAACERERQWEKLADALARALPLATDPSDAAELGFRLAQVQLQRVQDPDQAITTLRAALAARPDHIPARRFLGRLYTRRQEWSELIELHRREHEVFSEPQCRAAALYRIGDLLEHRIGDLQAAAQAYEGALAELPAFRPAVQGIGRTYAALDRYEELVEIFEREVAQCGDPMEKALLLQRIAALWEQRLGDPAASVSAYERLLAIEPGNAQALQALRRIYTLGNSHRALVAVLRADADQSEDRWRRISLLTDIADIEEQQLEDPDAALDTYLDALAGAPDHQPALVAAGRLLKRKGDWARLVELHRRELDFCDDPAHRAWLLLKIARIQLERLDQLAAATETLEEAVRLQPAPSAAADQLLRSYRQRGDTQAALALLLKLPLPDAPAARSLRHRQIAELIQLGPRPTLAVEHLRRALGASDDDAAAQLLARLYVTVEDRASLISLYQLAATRAEDTSARVAAYHKLARLWFAGDDLDQAVKAFSHLLEHAPRDPVILRQLEGGLYRLGRWEEAVSVVEIIRETAEDEDYRRACALQTAGLREDRLLDVTGAAQSAVEVLSRVDADPEALAVLERYYRRAENAEGLAQVLARQVKAAQTIAEQVALLTALGATHAQQGELARSVEIFRLAVERMPTHLPSVAGWQHAARQLEDWAQLAFALEAEAAATLDATRQLACLLEAGQTWQRAADAERAIATYRGALERAPGHPEAVQALAALFTGRGEYDQLVALLLHAADCAGSPDTRRDILARVASLQHTRLDDLAAARRTIARALEEHPDHRPLLTTLAELCRLGSDWTALTEADERLVACTDDPILLKALHFELGTLWEERLNDPRRAIGEYRAVLRIDPDDLGALCRLSALLYAHRDWRAAAQVTERLVSRDDDRGRVREHHLRLSQIYAHGFDDLPRAIDACRRALALDPGDIEAAEQMAALLTGTGDLRGLHAHLESTLTVHRARLQRDPFRIDSYQALLRVFARQRAPDRSYTVCRLLTAIGAASKTSHAQHAARRAPNPPSRSLTDDEIEHLLVHAGERGPLRRVLCDAEALLRRIFPPQDLPPGDAEKVTARSAPDLYALLRQLSKAMGGVTHAAFLVEEQFAERELWVEDAPTPSLFVSTALGQRIDEPDTQYRLARALAHLRLQHLLPARLGAERLGDVVAALLSTLCTTYVPPVDAERIEPLILAIEKALPRRGRSALAAASLELSDRPLAAADWLAAMVQSEDRVALAVCGDPEAALRTLFRDEGIDRRVRQQRPDEYGALAGPRIRELLGFTVSEEHLTLRERLGVAIG